MSRTLDTNRVASSNRVAQRDMKASLLFDGNDYIQIENSAGEVFNNTDFTVKVKVKFNSFSGNDFIFAHQESATNNRIYMMTINGVLSMSMANNVTLNTIAVQIGKWYDIVGVWDRSTPAMKMYLDGELIGSLATGIGTPGDGLVDIQLGARVAGAEAQNCKIVETRCWQSQLIATQIQKMYYDNIIPSGAVLDLDFDTGAGATIPDLSGNGNDGTITGALWKEDSPHKPRQLINPNLVKNGDFSYVPPFVAVQTADGWIDGSAAGGGTGIILKPIFSWYLNIAAGGKAQFEKVDGYNTVKLIAESGGEVVEVKNVANTYYGIYPNFIKVKPSTEYKLEFYMKSAYTSGDSNDGAFMSVLQQDGNGNAIITNNSTKIKTTTGWTKYTVTFTTNVSTNAVNLECRLMAHTGAATLIMTANIRNIELKPTTPTARALIT